MSTSESQITNGFNVLQFTLSTQQANVYFAFEYVQTKIQGCLHNLGEDKLLV